MIKVQKILQKKKSTLTRKVPAKKNYGQESKRDTPIEE